MKIPQPKMPAGERIEGFTLIEVALSLFVVLIGLLGIFALFPAGLQASRSAVDESRVALLADSILSDLRMHMAQNFEPKAASFAYPVETSSGQDTIRDGGPSDLRVYDSAGGEPIGLVTLQVRSITAEMSEAILTIKPGGYQQARKFIYYARYVDLK